MSVKKYKFFIIITLIIGVLNSSFADRVKVTPKNTLLIEVTLNQKKQSGIYFCYEDKSGNIWINENDLQTWNIYPENKSNFIIYKNKKYYSLRSYKNIHYHLNRNKLILDLWLPDYYFSSKVISLSQFNPYPLRPPFPGAFLNYDMTSIKNTHVNTIWNSGLFGLGYFNRYGVGTTNILVGNYNALQANNARYHTVRLTTTWTLDKPEEMASWRFGDAITGSSSFSGAAQFGGIQYATNFSTQPSYITFPLPGIKGNAVVPTNVQIFVNGILNQNKVVENGAYAINNIPVVTGAGTVNVVTQDLLGRTQTIVLSYYTSPLLLKAGLSDFSYELGFLRNNYGIDSNNYSHALAVATWQKGITNRLTLGYHLELLSQHQTLGLSAHYLIKKFGILSLACAKSASELGGGGLGSVGFIRQTPLFSYGFKTTYASSHYQQLGYQIGKSEPVSAVTTNQIFFGYDTGYWGSFALSYTVTKSFPLPDTVNHPGAQLAKIGTLSYSKGLGKNITFFLSAVNDFHHHANNQYYAAFIFTLDKDHTLSVYGNHQNKQTQPGLLYARNLPLGNGYGYHLVATNNGPTGSGGDFTYQNEIGTYTGKIYHVENKNYYEADISGAAIWLDHHGFLSRQMTQSFALVQVPGYENVRIYYQNQLIGKTNHDGNLLVPQILPYQDNLLTMETRDLPLTAKIVNTSVNVRPYYLSGIIAKFNVYQPHYLTLRLTQTNGDYVPIGSDVELHQLHYLVGYEGLLFFPVQENIKIHQGKVSWGDQSCYFSYHDRSIKSFNHLRPIYVSCLPKK